MADAVVPVSLIRASAEHLPFAEAGLRYDRDDVDVVLNPESARGAAWRCGGFSNRAVIAFRRARSVAGNRIARWQHWLTPCWKRIGGGCHLDRKMDDLIRAAGFEIDAIETGYMKGPKPWTFMYRGSATK